MRTASNACEFFGLRAGLPRVGVRQASQGLSFRQPLF